MDTAARELTEDLKVARNAEAHEHDRPSGLWHVDPEGNERLLMDEAQMDEYLARQHADALEDEWDDDEYEEGYE